jgi:hypothetical protein
MTCHRFGFQGFGFQGFGFQGFGFQEATAAIPGWGRWKRKAAPSRGTPKKVRSGIPELPICPFSLAAASLHSRSLVAVGLVLKQVDSGGWP